MSRTTIIVLIAFGAAIAGFVLSSAAERFRDGDEVADASVAAGPQTAKLGWREMHGAPGQQFVFSVETLEVLRSGWRAHVSVENDTTVAYELDDPRGTLDRSFGLMLFSSGDPEELEELNAAGELPPPRLAEHFAPPLPVILEPRSSWEGTMSASGALASGRWVRVVFGTLVAAGNPPAELDDPIVWITDHSYRLRE